MPLVGFDIDEAMPLFDACPNSLSKPTSEEEVDFIANFTILNNFSFE
jgi:hypothetical protein